MRPTGVLIPLLLLATVLVDAAMLIAGSRVDFPHPLLIVIWALQISQVSLLAMWLALGRRPAWIRTTIVVLLVVLWSGAMSRLPNAGQPEAWLLLLVTEAAAVSLPLMVARSLGVQVIPPSGIDLRESQGGRFQFTIAHMLGWTTAVAVALSTLKYVAPEGALPFKELAQWPLVVAVVGLAAMSLTTLWAVLRPRYSLLGGGLLLVSGLATFWLLCAGSSPWTWRSLGLLVSLSALLLLGSLWVFRVAGHRLTT